MATGTRGSWPQDTIYSEAVCPTQDVFYVGSDDDDYQDENERKQRCEEAGQRFLAGHAPFLLSASLQGPFDKQSGWINPWASKKHSTTTVSNGKHKKTKPLERPRETLRTAVEAKRKPISDSLECHLPSPQSLKQVSLSEGHPFLEDDELEMVQAWRHSVKTVHSPDSNPVPPKTSKRKESSGEGWLKTVSTKRQKSHRHADKTHDLSSPAHVADADQNRSSTRLPSKLLSKPALKPPCGKASVAVCSKTTFREPTSQLISPPKRTPPKKGKAVVCDLDTPLDGEGDAAVALSSPVSLRAVAWTPQQHSRQDNPTSDTAPPQPVAAFNVELPCETVDVAASKLTEDQDFHTERESHRVLQQDESFVFDCVRQDAAGKESIQTCLDDNRSLDGSDAGPNEAATSSSVQAFLDPCGDIDIHDAAIERSDQGIESDAPAEHCTTNRSAVEEASNNATPADETAMDSTESELTEMESGVDVEMENACDTCESAVLPYEEPNAPHVDDDTGAKASENGNSCVGLNKENQCRDIEEPSLCADASRTPNEAEVHKRDSPSVDRTRSLPLCSPAAIPADELPRSSQATSIEEANTTTDCVNETIQGEDSWVSGMTDSTDLAAAAAAAYAACTGDQLVIPSVEESFVKEESSEFSLRTVFQRLVPSSPWSKLSQLASGQADAVRQVEQEEVGQEEAVSPARTEETYDTSDAASPHPSTQRTAESNNQLSAIAHPTTLNDTDNSASVAMNDNEDQANCTPSIERVSPLPEALNVADKEPIPTPTTPEQPCSAPVTEDDVVSASQQSPWPAYTRQPAHEENSESQDEQMKDVSASVANTFEAVTPRAQSPWAPEPTTSLDETEETLQTNDSPCPGSRQPLPSGHEDPASRNKDYIPSVRLTTPEPQFAFKPFASFMTPSPERFRISKRRSGLRKSLRHPDVKSILVSSYDMPDEARQRKHVTWALISDETDKPSSDTPAPSKGQSERPASPPPAAPLADLPTSADDKFSRHFSAVIKRTDGLRHSFHIPKDREQPASSWQETNEAMVQANGAVDVEMQDDTGGDNSENRGGMNREASQSQEPMDMVEDMLCEMGDFWQPWSVETELDQAKRANNVLVPALARRTRGEQECCNR